jgi:hypothetical protein
MKALSSALAAFVLTALVTAPALRAETPPDQVKAAGAILLTTALLDKMDAAVTGLSGDDAAKKELSAASADPSISPDNWGSSIDSKCPKVAAVFKTAGISADDFGKALFVIMAVSMGGDDMAKSEDKNVKANAEFMAANKDKVEKTFGKFMELSMPFDKGDK